MTLAEGGFIVGGLFGAVLGALGAMVAVWVVEWFQRDRPCS